MSTSYELWHQGVCFQALEVPKTMFSGGLEPVILRATNVDGDGLVTWRDRTYVIPIAILREACK